MKQERKDMRKKKEDEKKRIEARKIERVEHKFLFHFECSTNYSLIKVFEEGYGETRMEREFE